MNFLNSYREGAEIVPPESFLFDDSVGSYSLRVIPMSLAWTQALVSVRGGNGVTDVYADSNGTISEASLTTNGDTFEDWNTSQQSDVYVNKWYAQNNANVINTTRTLTSVDNATSPTLWRQSLGFNYENGKIALSFDGSDELKSATANTALSSPSSLTITTVAKNTLAASNGQYFKTSNSITAFNIAQNSTTNKKCVGIAPYQLNSINTNTNLAQRILIFYKDGSTRSLALNGVLQDTLTQTNNWANDQISIGSSFIGSIQEVTISDNYYTNTLTDLANEINDYYQTYYQTS